jgi:hypothetical protein
MKNDKIVTINMNTFPGFVIIQSPSLERSHGTAIGALPANTAAGQSPQIFLHTGIANLKPAGAGPAKKLLIPAAAAHIFPFNAFSFAYFLLFHLTNCL